MANEIGKLRNDFRKFLNSIRGNIPDHLGHIPHKNFPNGSPFRTLEDSHKKILAHKKLETKLLSRH